MNFKQLAVATVLGATMTLAGCGTEPEAVVEAEPEGIPGMSVENARLVLPPVSGNPAAVYFDLTYEGDKGLSIRRADVAGADEAQLHAYGEYDGKMVMAEAMPIPLRKGTEVSFKPGDLHVMAFGLPETVAAGDSVEVTLTVSGGDKYSFDAEVRAAGDAR